MVETKAKPPVEVKSSTQQLLDEIRKLRQINEVLLAQQKAQNKDRLWRNKIAQWLVIIVLLVSLPVAILNLKPVLVVLFAVFCVTITLALWTWPTDYQKFSQSVK